MIWVFVGISVFAIVYDMGAECFNVVSVNSVIVTHCHTRYLL
jgi:hypothetical protein